MSYAERFAEYFARPVAEKAARSLSEGIEIELQIIDDHQELEAFTFTRKEKKNLILPSRAPSPEMNFILSPDAADRVLSHSSEDIGQIGVEIAKMILSSDPKIKIGFRLHVGFLTLFSKGYLGVVKSGGGAFASFLASKGLNGMSGIKQTIQKLKGAS